MWSLRMATRPPVASQDGIRPPVWSLRMASGHPWPLRMATILTDGKTAVNDGLPYAPPKRNHNLLLRNELRTLGTIPPKRVAKLYLSDILLP